MMTIIVYNPISLLPNLHKYYIFKIIYLYVTIDIALYFLKLSFKILNHELIINIIIMIIFLITELKKGLKRSI